MKLVADTNILFSFFWGDSLIKQILVSPNMEIFSPKFAIGELNKYSSLIITKTKIAKGEFNSGLKSLNSIIKFLPEKYYKAFMKLAEEISPDKADAHFLALCLKLNLPLWSNDKELKNQNRIVILDTEDLLNLYLA